MKSRLIVSFILAASIPATIALAAEEFGNLSNEELFQMQDQVRYMGEEERSAYRTERQSRMTSMNQEERQAMRNTYGSGEKRSMSGSGQSQGAGTRSRLRDGSGGGGGNRYGGGGRH